MGGARHFQRHGRGVFNCAICGRGTRQSTQDSADSELCPQDWDLAGLDNTVNDNGLDPSEYAAERDRLLAAIVARGGDPERVKAAHSFLWPAG